ncbi:cupin domain-containing protein [Propionivibrio limicola]|uniref:cupin domain-containing protein n=1 Tax=Propionivibrio limicola TaxID=167645 RepID=UPI001292B229|nr:cupin domain-containing protein [Propionivibrio limicola]
MANYKRITLGDIKTLGRITLHNDLALTGSEVSINELPAGVAVPFVHAHQQNEEVYLILSGKGLFYLDGEELALCEGDVLRVDPVAKRCIKADAGSSLRFVCIQSKANSLNQFTETDGVPAEGTPSWM